MANDYDASRPSYAKALIDCLYEKYNFQESSIIADIGFGTGKFAKQLLDRGSFVFGVEPNEDMRLIATKQLSQYPNLKILDGTDSSTGLPNQLIDFITVAQAFHWFDPIDFQKECSRILKPNGKVILVWNMRDLEDKVNQINYQIFKKYCPNFYGFSGGIKEDETKIFEFFNGSVHTEKFLNSLYFTKEKFIQRCLSASYSLRADDENYEAYIEDIANLFDDYAENGNLTVSNYTKAYIGEV